MQVQITDQLKDLMDARGILAKAAMSTVGMWPANKKVWRAIEYIDTQTSPIIAALLADPEEEAQLEGAA